MVRLLLSAPQYGEHPSRRNRKMCCRTDILARLTTCEDAAKMSRLETNFCPSAMVQMVWEASGGVRDGHLSATWGYRGKGQWGNSNYQRGKGRAGSETSGECKDEHPRV